MNAQQVLEMFSDGNTSLQDARSLMVSLGYSINDFTGALESLTKSDAYFIRVGKARRDDMQSDLFLSPVA